MVPRTLPEFLKRTGWEEADPARLERMGVALAYYLRVHQPIARLDDSTTGPQHGANVLSFRIDGRVTKLCVLMQCICFDGPVTTPTLKAGTMLKKFTDSNVPTNAKPSGDWFTTIDQPQGGLAIKPDQSIAHHFTLKRDVESLRCMVADALVDWRMNVPKGETPRRGVDYWYRKGGGVQFFVPGSAHVLGNR